jgi:membrane-bound lytic murein transglycosylase MltF
MGKKTTEIFSEKLDSYFFFFAEEAFKKSWNDHRWFKAQALAESGLDPRAVSPVGAKGIMQLMPDTAAEMAALLKIVDFDVFNPMHNIRCGIAYDRRCWDVWKKETGIERIRFMLGSYNAGVGNILKAQALAEKYKLPTDQWFSICSTLYQVTGAHAFETIKYVWDIEQYYKQLMEGTL